MTYHNKWAVTYPPGTTAASLISSTFRNFKLDMQDRISDLFGITDFTTDPLHSNYVRTGYGSPGKGGYVRLTDDDGNERWRAGLLNTIGAVNYSIQDRVNNTVPFSIDAVTGNVSFLGAISSLSPLAGVGGRVATLTLLQLLSHNIALNPLDCGAVGDGVHDDTAAIQACINNLPAGGGVILIVASHKITAPLITPSGKTVIFYGANGPATSKITNTFATDMFTLGNHSFPSILMFQGMGLISSATSGHIFNASTHTIVGMKLSNCALTQNNAAKSIWNQTGVGQFIDCIIEQCTSTQAGAASTPAWNININGGLCKGNTWERVTFYGGGAYPVRIGNADSGTWQQDNVFRDIRFEDCTEGCVQVLGARNTLFEQCNAYNFASGITAHLFDIGAAGGTGIGTTFRNCTRIGGTLGGGIKDINVAITTDIEIHNTRNIGGDDFAIDLGGSNGFITGPLQSTQIANPGQIFLYDGISVKQGVGGVLYNTTWASAFPVAGTHHQGDIVWNSNAAIASVVGWVCITSGTPGTWMAFARASNTIPSLQSHPADSDVTLTVGVDGETQLLTHSFIVDRFAYLDKTGAINGDRFTIAHTSTAGAGDLKIVNGAPSGVVIATITSGAKGSVTVVFDGTDWQVISKSSAF